MWFLRKYIQSQIQEIASVRGLCWYGSLLSLIHIVTIFFWNSTVFIHHRILKNADALCWPDFPFCEFFKMQSPLAVQISLYIYGSLALWSCLLFLNKKTVSWGWWLLLAVSIIKFYYFLMDYRLMGNYHYMPFVISFVFLFIRRKLFFIPLFIVLFYFFAGILKVSNMDWLSGLAFIKIVQFPIIFHQDTTVFVSFYVVCLELIGAWFLLLRSSKWKWFFYFQFILFHIISYFFVGYYYPAIMLLLLPAFVFFYMDKKPLCSFKIKTNLAGILALVLMVFGNLLSLMIPGPSALTGEGRFYGLTMFDAHTHCDSQILLKFKNQTIQESFSTYDHYAVRIHCDPYIEFNMVKRICKAYKEEADFIDLDWSFYSKLNSDIDYRLIVNEKNVCSQNLKYFSWRKNHWIKY